MNPEQIKTNVFQVGESVVFKDMEVRNNYGVMIVEQVSGNRVKLNNLLGLYPSENLIPIK